jgi:hypothetical protein
MHPFSILPRSKDMPLLLRSIHSRDDQLPSTKFDYDVLDGEKVVGRIYFNNEVVGARWFWSINGLAIRGEQVPSGSAESLHDAKMAFAAAWDIADKR